MTQPPDKQSIIQAAERIEKLIHRTPVMSSHSLDEMTGGKILFKCENLQKAGAFKSRGACNAVFSLDENLLSNGVCTHSSGNHAAALSRAAALRGIKAYIVMPSNSSKVKIAAVEKYGGEITFCSPNLKAREDTLAMIKEKTGAVEIHPYNDFTVIAGQATAAKEFTEDAKELDMILVPVGGGGLLAGTALATHFFSQNTKIIAAEPKGADDAYRSFISGELIPSVAPDTIADGLLTSLGTLTFPVIKDFVQEIITVDESSIIKAMKLIWERMKLVIEPSSAVPFAAILENKEMFKNKRTGIIISGGNVDLSALPW